MQISLDLLKIHQCHCIHHVLSGYAIPIVLNTRANQTRAFNYPHIYNKAYLDLKLCYCGILPRLGSTQGIFTAEFRLIIRIGIVTWYPPYLRSEEIAEYIKW